MPILGHFDTIDQNHAIGWALDTQQPNQRLRVEIIQGEDVIASGVAEHLHKAFAAENIGDGKYAFEILLPPQLLGQTANLKARIAGSDVWLEKEHAWPQAAMNLKMAGAVDGISSGMIFGWVAGANADDKPAIEIRQGTKVIGQASVGFPRKDIADQGLAATAFSFNFDLTPHLKGKRSKEAVSLINTASGQALAGSPVSIAAPTMYGHVTTLIGIELHGWATLAPPHVSTEHAVVELWIDGRKALDAPANLPRADFLRFGISQWRCGFKVTIPGRYLDGQPHTLHVRQKGGGQLLPGGEQTFTFTLHHAISYANNSHITGWAFIEQSPTRPLMLEAWEDEKCIAKAEANQSYPPVQVELLQKFGVTTAGFTLSLPAPAAPHRPRRVRICHAGQTESLTGQDIIIAPRAELVRQAEIVTRQDDIFRWWAHELIVQLRRFETSDGTLFKEIPAALSEAPSIILDVIVPVYKGRAETLACLQSLLATPDTTPHEIIVINDASPDNVLAADLRDLAKAHPRLTLLENTTNLGFVATVNRGMALHQNRDVLLLNSDTVTPATDWLTRLRAAAQAEATIATVTPFSNRATICSLPSPNVDNDMPSDLDATALDTLCSQTNPSIRIDIPTAVGFCMLIKRAALNEVGLFDAERWAKGYGEENDFCIKAASIGWKHVVACDVFVQHHGAVSFQGEKQARVQANLSLLNALYPDYPATIDRFIRNDPLAAPRNRIVLYLMQQAARQQKIKNHVLHITHAWGGGVHYHVDKLCRPAIQTAKEKSNGGLILRPTRDGRLEIFQPASNLSLSMALAELEYINKPDSLLRHCLSALNTFAVHVHQWIGLPSDVWQLPAALGVPLEYTVHDYYSFCPRINMLDYTGQFCEQAPLVRCEHCVKAKTLEPEVERVFSQLGGTVAAWRDFHRIQLATARRITAPCLDAATRIQRAFALKRVSAKPHDELAIRFKPKPPRKPGDELRVAVIGAIGPNKGYDLLLALVQLAEAKAQHIRFVIVGYTMDDTPFEALANVTITGKYAPENLSNLLDELDCHIALFLSPWPETYSYTLSEALRAGLTPIVPALGALGERVIIGNAGITMPVPFSPTNVLDLLVQQKAGAGSTAANKSLDALQLTSS